MIRIQSEFVWLSSKQLLLCLQGKEPSDQHIRQVCMRVMQGESGSKYFYNFRHKHNFPFKYAEPHFCHQRIETFQAKEHKHEPLKERVRSIEGKKLCFVSNILFDSIWWAETLYLSYPSVLPLSKSSWAHAADSLMTFSFTFLWKIHFPFSWSALLPHSDEFPPSASAFLRQTLPETAQSSIVLHTFSGRFPTESWNSLYPSSCSMAQGLRLDSLHLE